MLTYSTMMGLTMKKKLLTRYCLSLKLYEFIVSILGTLMRNHQHIQCLYSLAAKTKHPA